MGAAEVIGIDITKSVFQVCVWMADGSVAWNRKIVGEIKVLAVSERETEELLRISPLVME